MTAKGTGFILEVIKVPQLWWWLYSSVSILKPLNGALKMSGFYSM